MSSVSGFTRITLGSGFVACCVLGCVEDDPAQQGQGIANLPAHLALVASTIPSVGLTGELECTDGGSRSQSLVNRESPFTSTPLDAERFEYVDCVHLDVQPNSNVTRREKRGIEEHGTLTTSGSAFFYTQEGSDDGTVPLEYRFTLPIGSDLIEERTLTNGRIDMHATFGAGPVQLETRISRSQQILFQHSNGSRFEGSYRLGTASEPLVVRYDGSEASISGEYEIDTPLCSSGAMRVVTHQDLAYDVTTNTISRGSLEFIAADGSRATATFLGNSRVLLRSGAGAPVEIQNPFVRSTAWNSECFGEWMP